MTEQSSRQPGLDPYRRPKMIFLVIFIITLVGLSSYLYFTPWVSEEIDIGLSTEARRNPFLAAETFLGHFDIPVKTQNGLNLLDDLPSTDDSLLIASSRRSLSERRVNDLTDWIYRGGALILLASDLYDEERDDKGDRLLNDFGIWLYEGEPEYDDADPVSAEEYGEPEEDDDEPEQPKNLADILSALQNTGADCTMGDGMTEISIEDERRDLVANMSTTRHLYFEDSQDYVWASNSTGAQLVYIEHGDGRLYVVTSLSQWRNRNIGCFDHAHLLRSLTENTNTLWLMFNTEIEPLHLLIWKKWPIAIALLLGWLVLWLWRSAYRTTRIEPEETTERREVVEHISGMSRFLYQQKEVELLLASLRADCFTGNANTSSQKRQLKSEVERWSEQLGISEDQIQWALQAKIPREGRQLINAVALLQKIRSLPKAQKSNKQTEERQ